MLSQYPLSIPSKKTLRCKNNHALEPLSGPDQGQRAGNIRAGNSNKQRVQPSECLPEPLGMRKVFGQTPTLRKVQQTRELETERWEGIVLSLIHI